MIRTRLNVLLDSDVYDAVCDVADEEDRSLSYVAHELVFENIGPIEKHKVVLDASIHRGSKMVGVNLDAADRAAIAVAAKKHGLGLSAYCRAVIRASVSEDRPY